MTAAELPALLFLAVAFLLVFSLLFRIKQVVRFLSEASHSHHLGFRIFRVVGTLALCASAWKAIRFLIGYPD